LEEDLGLIGRHDTAYRLELTAAQLKIPGRRCG
jgi:hypothetical protein